jgi:hypothetical protein
MSFLQQIFEGSFLSSERLMQAREFYSPFERNSPTQLAFARWTQRVSVQPALGGARELAGLSDGELAELEAEFVRCPMRRQPPWVRHAVVVGGTLMVLACLGLGLQALAELGETATRTLQAASVACLLAGLLPLGVGLVSAFGALHVHLSHGTTGLYVGKLDEQHPWLYSAISLTRYKAAEDYRQRTLRERGPLRGADYVMMRELVQAQEALERVRPARSVAAQLQFLTNAAEALAHEPRLVRVGAAVGRDSSSEAFEPGMSRFAAN